MAEKIRNPNLTLSHQACSFGRAFDPNTSRYIEVGLLAYESGGTPYEPIYLLTDMTLSFSSTCIFTISLIPYDRLRYSILPAAQETINLMPFDGGRILQKGSLRDRITVGWKHNLAGDLFVRDWGFLSRVSGFTPVHIPFSPPLIIGSKFDHQYVIQSRNVDVHMYMSCNLLAFDSMTDIIDYLGS